MKTSYSCGILQSRFVCEQVKFFPSNTAWCQGPGMGLADPEPSVSFGRRREREWFNYNKRGGRGKHQRWIDPLGWRPIGVQTEQLQSNKGRLCTLSLPIRYATRVLRGKPNSTRKGVPEERPVESGRDWNAHFSHLRRRLPNMPVLSEGLSNTYNTQVLW